jgi:NAD(P)H-quinone oxidoreductase subunit 6
VFLLMAMVGAIILARRDYISDILPTQKSEPPVLTLQERPRELISVASDRPQKGE